MIFLHASNARSPQQSFIRRATAAAAALAVLLGSAVSGVALASGAAAVPAPVCTAGDLWNPMGAATPVGSDYGYTVFTTGDTVLANQELEGSLAVGGTVTFGAAGGVASQQYPIVHTIAGNGDYVLPVVDGAPNRVLIDAYAPGVGDKIVQVTDRGALTPDQVGGVKLFDRATPADFVFQESFGSDGTTFVSSTGNNNTAQLDSHVQRWDLGAGAATFEPAEAVFADYFPADVGTDLLAQAGIWKAPLSITSGGETRVTLDPSGPNRVTFSQIATGDAKFDISGYSATAPLVITVSASDLVAGELTMPSIGQAGSSGDKASYVLWDLSALTGDVTLKTVNEPIRGAIYGPQAHVIVPDKELEGQVVASKFTARADKEIHTNLFTGQLPCVATTAVTGGFSLAKVVSNVDGVTGLPTSYDVDYFFDGAATAEGRLSLVAGAPAQVVANVPVGTVVTFAEVAPGAVAGATWGAVSISSSSVTIAEGTVGAVVVTNTITANVPTDPTDPGPGPGDEGDDESGEDGDDEGRDDESDDNEARDDDESDEGRDDGREKGRDDDMTAGDELGRTGIETLGLLGGAALLLVAGVTLIAVRRRGSSTGSITDVA